MPKWHPIAEESAFSVDGLPRGENAVVGVRVRVKDSIWKVGNLAPIEREDGPMYGATCSPCLPHHKFFKAGRWVECAGMLAKHWLEYHRRS